MNNIIEQHSEDAGLSANKWQSIDTAPKDGSKLLVFDGEEITSAFYDKEYECWEICVPSQGGRYSDEVYPTHWMQLPLKP